MSQITQVEVTRVEAIPTAVIRQVVPQPELPVFLPAACGEVWDFFRKNPGLPRPGRHMALYMDYTGGTGTVEAGAEIPEPLPSAAESGRIRGSSLPAGRVATVTHFGPYPGLSAAHAALRNWCLANGFPPSDTGWEIYGHWEEAWNHNPSQIRTDVFHLLPEA